MKHLISIAFFASTSSIAVLNSAFAQERVTLYCPAPGDWCQIIANDFEKASGIGVNVLRKSAGEVIAQIRAEKANPKADIWWGGISDSHFAAAEEGLTVPVTDLNISALAGWAKKIYEQSNKHAVGIYSLSLGFAYNPELLANKNIKPPSCWADLTKKDYAIEIQMANPNSSGTAYQIVASVVQLMGEEAGFEYLKKLHLNINTYQRSGVAPSKAVARGETGVAITYMQDADVEMNAGLPIRTVAPCEGASLGIDAMSLVKGSPNPVGARKFYDWLLTAEGQSTSMKAKMMHTPANPDAIQPPSAQMFKEAKYIDYDYKAFGNSARRSGLIKRWENEVYSIAK